MFPRISFQIGTFATMQDCPCDDKTIYPIYHQTGGGQIKSVETVIYVMLEIPKTYEKDVKRLIDEFISRYGKKFANHYDFKKPNPKHITIAQADLVLTNYHLKTLTKKWRSGPITLAELKSDSTGQLFGELTSQIELELTDYMTDILLDLFENVPNDTTASCYASRYNLYGKFIVVQYKPDLGFHALIVPAIKNGLLNFFDGIGHVKMGKFYRDPKDIMLHISLAKEKKDDTCTQQLKRIAQVLQSTARVNYIQPGIAKNFVISHEIINSFQNPVWISLGSYGTFK